MRQKSGIQYDSLCCRVNGNRLSGDVPKVITCSGYILCSRFRYCLHLPIYLVVKT